MPERYSKYRKVPIHVVEDDTGLSELICDTLESEGFSCIIHNNAESIISSDTLEKNAFLLLDYTLPDMNGKELIESLKAKGLDRPFIVITGREDAGTAVNMLKMGARDYIHKDINFLDNLPATLMRALQELETENRLQETLDALKESEARLEKAQHLSKMGSWELEIATGIVTCSSAMFKILGYEQETLTQMPLNNLLQHIHEEDAVTFKEEIEALKTSRLSFSRDIKIITLSGEHIHVNAQGEVDLAEHGEPIFISGTIIDITERKHAERKIEQLAFFDSLTTLPNRSLLNERLHQSITLAQRDNRRLAVMFIDLDRFKSINDTLGHLFGDRLLKVAADRISRCIRESDTVARLGGDEFIVLVNSVKSSDDISNVAEKIRNSLNRSIIIEGKEVYTTASMGIAIFPEDGSDATTLLKHADSAMYLAKETGRNNHQFFSSEINRKVAEHLHLETALRRGVNHEEFQLFYQPQFDAKTKELVGMEALLRWNHSELGLIPPSRFIPVAEETGIILQLGNWVLESACSQSRLWLDLKLPPIRIAVNLSAKQFIQPDLTDQVLNAMKKASIPPELLELEITESTVMTNPEMSRDQLLELKKMGISIAIDDFGTGYSSLAYLKHFPIDRLKIDRAFVFDITDNPDDAVIVDAIIAMAHSLKMKVTAEGVEKREHLGYLCERNCDEIQGFFLGTPLSSVESTRFMLELVEKR